MNVDQKILALEALLEKVRTNAAKPRPARGAAIATPQPTTAAARPTDDVAGPAVAATAVRVAPPVAAVGTTKFGDDDWSDTTEQFETPVPLAAPLGGAAKDAAAKAAAAAATAKPGPTKSATPVATAKPADPAPAKPAVATPAIAPVKPVVAPPTINKPVVTSPVVKPVVTTPTAKPATPQNAPIPLTKQVAAPVIKTPTAPVTPAATAARQAADAGINKTLTGVGDGAVKAPDIRAGAVAAGISLPTTGEPPAVELVVDLEKKPLPIKTEAASKPGLPSVIADSDGEEDAEPTQLYEASAASIRAAELAQLAEKQLEEAKKSLGIDKKSDSDKVDIRLPDAKATPEKIEVKVDAQKLDLPWVDKTERRIDPEKIGLPTPEDKLPKKKGPSQTELDLEMVASQEGADLEKVELDVGESKAEAKPVPEDKPAAKPESEPISEKKPIVDTKPEPEKKPVVDTKPALPKKPVVDEPVLEKPTAPSRGVPKLLIVAAAVLLLAAGAFVAMKQGWIGGAAPTPTQTVAPPTTPTPTATQAVAPPATQTAQPATTDTAAPAVSASAAPADSAAAPADSAATAPADSAAAPPASASAAAEPPPAPVATAGTPSVDPATLNNNQGLIFVTSNKPARVYLTGKLAGDTNTELKTDCGLKFVRLADPTQDITKPPMWLTAGQPQQIDCRKYTTFTINVP